MNFDPQKIFIGLIEFFTIILPGALLTFLFKDAIGPWVLGEEKYGSLTESERWGVFLFSCYLSGHLVFLLSAWLDDYPYDILRGRFTLNQQIRRLAKHGAVSSKLTRFLVWTIFQHERNLAVERAGAIKQHLTRELQASSAVNTFQWSKAYLAKVDPFSLATVQRFEADSKFFRSFVLVLWILLSASLYQCHLQHALGALLLSLPALWRYMEQRYKATNQAYWSVITLNTIPGKEERLKLEPHEVPAGSPAFAGGVVFRRVAGTVEYLLLDGNHHPQEWVLPEGRVEPGEKNRSDEICLRIREAAVRAVHESAGVWARIETDLGLRVRQSDKKTLQCRYFMMEQVSTGFRQDKLRQLHWLSFDKAQAQASTLETRELLQAARHRIDRAPVVPVTRGDRMLRWLRRAWRLSRLMFCGPSRGR